MKKAKQSLLILAMGLVLSSCSFGINMGGNGVSLNDVTRNVYSAEKQLSGKSKEESKVASMTFKVNSVREHILYCDLESYASLFSPMFDKGVTQTVTSTQWTVTKNEQTVFLAGIDSSQSRFYYGGSLSSAYVPSPRPEMSISIGLRNEATLITSGSNLTYASFASFSSQIPLYTSGSKIYAPIALFDTVFGSSTGYYHYDNLNEFYQYGAGEELSKPLNENGDTIVTPTKKYHDSYGMPLDLRLLERSCFYFFLDNLYGLRFHKGIDSMTSYMRDQGFDASLMAEDDAKRSYAYYEAFARLNDGHTGITNAPVAWGFDTSYSHRGDFLTERAQLRKSLREARKRAYEAKEKEAGVDVLYSSSGETAFFSFDSFSPTESPRKEDGSLREDLWKEDSYFYFLREFEQIKNKGGVKNVIIDDSCNGGGTLGIAMKLLALISSDNKSTLHFQNLGLGSLYRYDAQVDSNLDGVYDLEDVYGDDFHIGILTSPFSFSCGNLFPIAHRQGGYGPILGVCSGGGECVVDFVALPSGMWIQTSGLTRLVSYDPESKSVVGFERGCGIDVALDYVDFYDVDAIEAKLS